MSIIDDPVKAAEAELITAVFANLQKIRSVQILKAARKLAKATNDDARSRPVYVPAKTILTM